MFIVLSLGTQYYIYTRLRAAGTNKFVLRSFITWAILWSIVGFVAGFDLSHAEYDIMPLHTAEILNALFMTWAIITLLGFFAFFAVNFLPIRHKIFCSLMLTILAILYGMWEAYFVTPRYVTIKTNKLPETINKIRLAYITDSHIGGLSTHWHFERTMKLIRDADPDIFISTGDTIDGDMTYRERELELLTAAAKNSRYGAFAVNGNHEHYWILDEDVEGIIRRCGFNLLINERVETAGIVIIGLDDTVNGWLKPFLESGDENKFVLVLKHRPGLPFDAKGKFDLQLSGHTHGGQFWPMGYFKNFASKSTQGLSQKAGGYVYVSNGSGFNGAMLRLFVPPEITVIDIVRE